MHCHRPRGEFRHCGLAEGAGKEDPDTFQNVVLAGPIGDSDPLDVDETQDPVGSMGPEGDAHIHLPFDAGEIPVRAVELEILQIIMKGAVEPDGGRFVPEETTAPRRRR